MSGIPPLSAQPGTPASEWAAQTATALDTGAAQTAPITTSTYTAQTSTPASTTMNPTTRQLFEEKNLRPGTTATAPAPTASTPSQEIPGAYPNQEELQSRGQEILSAASTTAAQAAETAGNLAQTAKETAATYLPKAAETVGQYLPKSVVDTVSTYIPGVSNPQGNVIASEHDHPHAKSLPSTEVAGAMSGEHVGGAGALPGPVGESEVAKVPDEKNATVPTASGMVAAATGAAVGATAAVAGAAQYAKESAQGAASTAQNTAKSAKDTVVGTAQQAKEKAYETAPSAQNALVPQETAVTTKYSLPSDELSGAKPGEHVGGVGALPGNRAEAGVATFPDENARGSTNATSSSVGTHGRTYGAATLPSQEQPGGVSGGVGSLPGRVGEEGVALLPDQRSENTTGTGSRFKKDAELAGAGAAAAGMGKWALDDKPQVQSPQSQQGGVPKQVGEDTAMAEAAKKAGVSSQQQQQTPESKSAPAPKDEGKKESGEKKFAHGKPNQGDGYDTDYHPAELHPLEGDYSKEHAEQEKEKEPAAEKDSEKPLTGAKHADSKQASHAPGTGSATDHDDDHPDKAKKVGFMQKMKGEAKILLGKVEGKKGHEKVEEGQKIKAGEPVH